MDAFHSVVHSFFLDVLLSMTDVFTSKMPILEALFTSVSEYSSVFVCLSTCLPASMSVCLSLFHI